MNEPMTEAPSAPSTPPAGSGSTASAEGFSYGGGLSGRATTGIVLIVLGLLFLVARFMPGFTWWSFWPLAIVAAGVVQAVTPGKEGWSVARMFDGLVTVAFGGVFLAMTMGVVGWDVWVRIISLWPVLLISVGFEVLSKALHASWPKLLGSLAIIAALGWSVFAASAGIDERFPMDSAAGTAEFEYEAPVLGAREARLVLEAGVARVKVGDGRDLVHAVGEGTMGRPRVTVDRSARPVEVSASLGGPDGVVIIPGMRTPRFDVSLAREVLWDMRVDTGVSDLTADLSRLQVAALDLRPGVAACDVKLGSPPSGVREARVDVRSGVSSVRLRIPESAQASVRIESGLSGNSVRGSFERVDSGSWETPGFADARTAGRPAWIITVKSGVGSITIDTY